MGEASGDQFDPVPEFYIGLVRAIGTPVQPVETAVERAFARVKFGFCRVKVADCLEATPLVEQLFKKPDKEAPFDRYLRLTGAALALRSKLSRKDAVIVTAIRQLHLEERAKAKAAALDAGQRGVAFLFRNVMHSKEVERLRKLYDRQFFLISVFSSKDDRIDSLAGQLGESERDGAESNHDRAKQLVVAEEDYFVAEQRYDQRSAGQRPFAIDIPNTFKHGDLFLDANDSDEANERQIRRLVNLIFGHPFHTPTEDEVGMADAYSAQLQSGNLARQVGAAICSQQGDLLATGTNDVPRPGGGVYREGDAPDYRDYADSGEDFDHLAKFKRGRDASDTMRRNILKDLLHRLLADPTWLKRLDELVSEVLGQGVTDGTDLAAVLEAPTPDGKLLHNKLDLEELAQSLIGSELIWNAQFFDVLEYGRTMHAEMDAITSAARKGVSIHDATLYCTTLPCHECARLIIGAGIKRVIFIEPYEKSRAERLYGSEIRFTTLKESRSGKGDSDVPKGRVDFVPYVGISPRRFQEVFSFVPRKLDDQDGHQPTLRGTKAEWTEGSATVRETIISDSALNSVMRMTDLIDHEGELIKEFDDELRRVANS